MNFIVTCAFVQICQYCIYVGTTSFVPMYTCTTDVVPICTCTTSFVPICTCTTSFAPIYTCTASFAPICTCTTNIVPICTFQGLGGAMILSLLQQWSCYLQGPGFESHLRPVEFLSCNKVSPLSNQNPTLTSVPCAPP